MPIPTPEDDRLAEIVETGATALAERDGVACFRPGRDTVDDQHIRDSYRREARVVIEATRAAVEAPLRAELDASQARIELARDALRRAGFGVDEVGDDIAGLIDRFNADARKAVRVSGTESAWLRDQNKRLRDELSAVGDLAYRFSYHESPSAVEDLLVAIVSRAKRAAKPECASEYAECPQGDRRCVQRFDHVESSPLHVNRAGFAWSGREAAESAERAAGEVRRG
jgi:hypothetical protein